MVSVRSRLEQFSLNNVRLPVQAPRCACPMEIVEVPEREAQEIVDLFKNYASCGTV